MYKISQAYSILGDKISALRVLRRSIEGGFFCYPYFTTDPLLIGLRKEAEFTTLLNVGPPATRSVQEQVFLTVTFTTLFRRHLSCVKQPRTS